MNVSTEQAISYLPRGQLVLVLSDGWNESKATLQGFCFDAVSARWRVSLGPFPAVLGRAGMALGIGLHMLRVSGVPEKREGDGRSPLGIFPITRLFAYGLAEEELARVVKMPLVSASTDLKCIDDPASAYYNRIIGQSRVEPDWRSCEEMLRRDGRYEIGAVIGHNCDPVVPGAGSCVFLHVWEAPEVPTAGCTAMARDHMLALARWLDCGLSPVLVQLPREVYLHVRDAWGLPDMES